MPPTLHVLSSYQRPLHSELTYVIDILKTIITIYLTGESYMYGYRDSLVTLLFTFYVATLILVYPHMGHHFKMHFLIWSY